MITLIGWIISGCIFGFVTREIIHNKGYVENWFWWGFFFGVFAILVAVTKPERTQSQRNWTSSGDSVSGMSGTNSQPAVQEQGTGKKDTGSMSEKDEKTDMPSIPILQYNHAPGLRPLSLTCQPYGQQYAFVITLKDFRKRDISAVMADICLHLTFGTTYEIKDIGFTNFEKYRTHITSGMTEYPLPQSQFILIEKADIILKKYVEEGKIVELSEDETALRPYEELSEEERQRHIKGEEVIWEAERLKNAKEIYEYLLECQEENEEALEQDFLDRIKRHAEIERLYGPTKDSCIKEIKKYFQDSLE